MNTSPTSSPPAAGDAPRGAALARPHESRPLCVVHCKRARYDVYIGRGGPWGNPFVIGRDGDRAQVIDKHRAWLTHRLATEPALVAQLLALHGKVLACWCAPLPCHGDTLVELAAQLALAQEMSADEAHENLHNS